MKWWVGMRLSWATGCWGFVIDSEKANVLALSSTIEILVDIPCQVCLPVSLSAAHIHCFSHLRC